MNTYITLGTKRYKTVAKSWRPEILKPTAVKHSLDGELLATFGPTNVLRWSGAVIGPVTPENSQYGSIEDLRTLLKTRQVVTFVDHYGSSYGAVVLGPFVEQSLQNVWDAPGNKIYVGIQVVAVETG